MSEYTLDVVKADIAALGKNVIKIRKYIRDHQSQLQGFSTTSLNKTVREHIPAGMVLKRNYNVLSLRSAGAPGPSTEAASSRGFLRGTQEESAPAPKPKKSKQVIVQEDEDVSDEEEEERPTAVRRPVRRPVPREEYEDDYSYVDQQMPHYMMTNEDLAKSCFLEAAQRKWRRFG